jgi:hypothetical protein
MTSTTSRVVARDRALRAVHLATGLATVLAMGATGAVTGALVPQAAQPVEKGLTPQAPMPVRIIHVPATRAASQPVVAPRQAAQAAPQRPPVVSSGAS